MTNLDIRGHIFARTFGQSLKLLKTDIPDDAFQNAKNTFPAPPYISYNSDGSAIVLSESEQQAFGTLRYMEHVRVADINVGNLENNPDSPTFKTGAPAILLDFGGTEEVRDHPNLPQNTIGEALMMIVRLVLPREKPNQVFLETNAMKTVSIREALDYLFDLNMYQTYHPSPVTDTSGAVVVRGRPGYNIGSRIFDIKIITMQNLGVVREKYITDFIVAVYFYQQRARGETNAVNYNSP